MTAVALLLPLLTSGCGGFAGLSSLPLPGGPDEGKEPILVTVQAHDVLNLSRQATVKVDDVTVGEVVAIKRVGWHAEVDLRLDRRVSLPANAVAAVRQTGLLGEKYIELAPPATERPAGALADGAQISIDQTSRSAEVEEVFGALSLLLNGGGIDRIRTITLELNKALDGREGEFRQLLTTLNSFTGSLADNRHNIVAALDGLDRLSASAAREHETIEEALDSIGPGLEVLADQRRELIQMLEATSRLSEVGTEVLTRSRVDLLANLEALDPILTQLAKNGADIPGALEYALTFPFSNGAMTALKGDYFNFDLDVSVTQSGATKLLFPSASEAPAAFRATTSTPKVSLAPQLEGVPLVDQLAPGVTRLVPEQTGPVPLSDLVQQLLGGKR